QAEDGIRDFHVTGVQTCALPIWTWPRRAPANVASGSAGSGGALARSPRAGAAGLRCPLGGAARLRRALRGTALRRGALRGAALRCARLRRAKLGGFPLGRAAALRGGGPLGGAALCRAPGLRGGLLRCGALRRPALVRGPLGRSALGASPLRGTALRGAPLGRAALDGATLCRAAPGRRSFGRAALARGALRRRALGGGLRRGASRPGAARLRAALLGAPLGRPAFGAQPPLLARHPLAEPALVAQDRATTLGRAAVAGVARLHRRRVRLVQDVRVVVRQLLARLDVADRLDEDAAILLHRLAVRIAGVIDPARVVAVPPAVDHRLVVHGEEEGVVGLDAVVVA